MAWRNRAVRIALTAKLPRATVFFLDVKETKDNVTWACEQLINGGLSKSLVLRGDDNFRTVERCGFGLGTASRSLIFGYTTLMFACIYIIKMKVHENGAKSQDAFP